MAVGEVDQTRRCRSTPLGAKTSSPSHDVLHANGSLGDGRPIHERSRSGGTTHKAKDGQGDTVRAILLHMWMEARRQ